MLMLLFYVGDHLFACDTSHIVEIVPKIHLNKIPYAPDYFAGLMNFGGMTVPVIDFCQVIAGKPCRHCMHTRIIFFKNPEPKVSAQHLGVIAEKVTSTIELEPKEFKDSGIRFKEFSFLDGVVNKDDISIQLVLAEELFKLQAVSQL